ncbi:MAG: hypothetical protein R6U26_03205 [Candidatus Undinarchaeales archaeon]
MKEIEDGEFAVLKSENIRAPRIYQCFGIVLYNSEKNIGGVYHAAQSGIYPTKGINEYYVKKALKGLKTFLKKIKKKSKIPLNEFNAVISGGVDLKFNKTLEKTLEEIKSELKKQKIRIIKEDTDGTDIQRELLLNNKKGNLLITKRAERRRWIRKIKINFKTGKIETKDEK